MAIDEFQSPQNPKRIPKGSVSVENGETREILISPGFRSVAAMAGWDEEALLCATLIVEDTPERESVHKKRVNLQLRTPPTNSRRKRRNQRVTPASNPIVVLNLDDEDDDDKEKESKKIEPIIEAPKEKKIEEQAIEKGKTSPAQQNSSLPCMDKLREELSCAICLEICFEPSTTPCGHSFCKKCLKSAADKCGKRCPKCRQLIGNGRSCTVNTILWNTIQLLFPQEVESRKAASVAAGSITKNSREASSRSSTMENHNVRTRQSSWNQASFSIDRTDRMVGSSRSRRATPSQAQDAALVSSNWSRRATPSLAEDAAWASSSWSRRATPNQAEDAALAFRLQREEFMEAFRGTEESAPAPRISSARANIRAMASRAINHRTRGGPM